MLLFLRPVTTSNQLVNAGLAFTLYRISKNCILGPYQASITELFCENCELIITPSWIVDRVLDTLLDIFCRLQNI